MRLLGVSTLKFSFSLFISRNITPSCQMSQQVRQYPLALPLLVHKELLLPLSTPWRYIRGAGVHSLVTCTRRRWAVNFRQQPLYARVLTEYEAGWAPESDRTVLEKRWSRTFDYIRSLDCPAVDTRYTDHTTAVPIHLARSSCYCAHIVNIQTKSRKTLKLCSCVSHFTQLMLYDFLSTYKMYHNQYIE